MRVLIALLGLTLAGLIVMAFYVRELRSDLNELVDRGTSSGASEGAPAELAVTGSELQQGLDSLRVCFNDALANSFEDFYRYVFGSETPPGVEKIVESCGLLSLKIEAQLYKRGLEFPVDLAWVEGTETIFFTEKATGNIRVLEGRELLPEPCATVPASSEGERGTLGIALDPDFGDNGYLYVYYTNEEPLENRVTRFVVDGNTCTDPEHIITEIPALESTRHVGGQIEILDDKLFVSVGDGYDDPATAQDPAIPLGKINRFNLDGSIPEDNPFTSGGKVSSAWSVGHRNPFGLAQNPETGQLYETENGADCDDELNLIVKGANYGWGPGYECGSAGVGPDATKALVAWTPPIVPTDLWFYTGATKELSGFLYGGDFGSGMLHRFVLNEDGTKVVEDEVIFDSPSQIVDVTEGPDELLYFATPTGIYRMVDK
jgi:aldose sugar dehydrogenase